MRSEADIRAELARLESETHDPEMAQNYAQYAVAQGKIAALRWVLSPVQGSPLNAAQD